MLGRVARIVVPIVIAFAVVGAAARDARADVAPRVDCTKVAADATLSLGANTPSVRASSDFPYAWFGCHRFVTDVYVPTSSSSGYADFDQFKVYGRYDQGYSGFLSNAACNDFVESVAVYRKTHVLGDNGFVYLGGGWRHGVWNSTIGYCQVLNDPGFVNLAAYSPPALFPVTYRIVVGAWVGSSMKQVCAGATYLPSNWVNAAC